jgi:hypothetical protein
MIILPILAAILTGMPDSAAIQERQARMETSAQPRQVVSVQQVALRQRVPLSDADRAAVERACRRFAAENAEVVIDIRTGSPVKSESQTIPGSVSVQI